jgi:F-type H+-transporting ATPase subunit epsilon
MKSFTILLHSPNDSVILPDVVYFKGRDASGSFGLMAHHERFMTVHEFGLAVVRMVGDKTRYVALPSALIYFVGNKLLLATRRFIISPDKEEVIAAISGIMRDEEEARTSLTNSIREMEQELTRKLWELHNRSSRA